ncbi:MAG: hypothetical protein HYY11_03975 [Candidatus Methylomirabilis oxyfera]|nr:hypothetical protein [Candidatus Methylomirabilis oxyfera]
MYLTVRCDILPGKEQELDNFLTERAKKFWLSQPGVKSFHVYKDTLVGWPERTIMIEVDDMSSLDNILHSDARQRVRREFQTYATDVQSQILDTMI